MHRFTLALLAPIALLVPADASAHGTTREAGEAGGALAHEELREAQPGADEELAEAPSALRLTFVNAVRLPSAHLSLTGPDGTVTLGELRRAADAANVLVASIGGGLVAGVYTVHWRIAGPDGHPVRGEYAFTILPDAAGLTPPDSLAGARAPSSDPVRAEVAAERREPSPESWDFDAGSPLYAGVRWLTFLGLLGTIGAVTFRFRIVSVLRRSEAPRESLLRAAVSRALVIGTGAVVLLIVALALRLYAQSYALHGPAGALEPGTVHGLLTGTSWSVGWWVQAVGTAMALVGFILARRPARGGWGLAAAGAALLAFSPALSGHAAAVTGLGPLAVLADGLHVIGAGGWLGTLLIVVAAGIPAALGQRERRGAAVASLINAFSPAALFFAAVVVTTGVFAAWVHLGAVPDLWTSAYGRTLLVKVGVVVLLFAAGAHNWLRVKPSLGDASSTARVRRSAALELAVGVLVLAVTAVLVATPPPSGPTP